jgi:PP-loop superfamily ATP-utilizing enzyme
MKNYADDATELVRSRISEFEEFEGRVVLLFSGGRDSSAVAAAFCKSFPMSQLHLLMIDNGLLSRMDSTKRQANLIKKLFPETDIVFENKRVSQMMRVAGMQQIEKDFTKRNFSTLLTCLACKLIMNFSAITYAKDLGIKLILDGYANRQSDYPEQTDAFMSFIREVYKKYGVGYISPLYDFLSDKPKVNQCLGELGVYIPKQEPICMFADSFSTAHSDEITKYCQKTLDIIEKHDHFLHC